MKILFYSFDYLTQSPIDYFLILSGDQLYNIDFHQIINFAIQSEADVVVAALPVPLEEATRMGILKVNDNHFITDFHEKPQEKDLLKTLISRLKPSEKTRAHTSKTSCYLGSMGIYVFRKKALYQIIKEDQSIDFGKHLIPRLVQEGRAAAFFYEGYWKDIGTIRSFYDANLALVDSSSPFDFYDEKRPIFSRNHNLPPAKFSNSQVKNALICDGAIIKSSKITHSIIGPGTVIEKDSVIKNSYLMGNSYYQSPVDAPPFLPSNPRIGEGCVIKGCIIDKNVTIGKRVKLLNINNLTNYDGKNIFIRDQVIVVPTGAIIPDDFII